MVIFVDTESWENTKGVSPFVSLLSPPARLLIKQTLMRFNGSFPVSCGYLSPVCQKPSSLLCQLFHCLQRRCVFTQCREGSVQEVLNFLKDSVVGFELLESLRELIPSVKVMAVG
ncbi:hypothetical protein AVEN_27727-1 [Araneus ventricosus]|uniref:Uncharacterized protein n=1 Tax=Araneus ventricosus TaxID=182803 RepID=A0A4Y2RX67_ARAVE|nr:hypothetical protein AVEN_27727-1 [Araneus ventricosus]